MNDLRRFLTEVRRHVERTRAKFATLERPGAYPHPVPFFGSVADAHVLTVGVNPSATEFIGRQWPEVLNEAELFERLNRYFTNPAVPPHIWFGTWDRAMLPVGVSYKARAAHLDLSPRATVSMGSVQDQKLCLEMVELDVEYLFKLLPLCLASKAILIAGSVTKQYYINEFLKRVAPRHDYELTGPCIRAGAGWTGVHRLRGPRVDLPVFFCSVSPSAQNKELLVTRILENAGTIRSWLNLGSTAAT